MRTYIYLTLICCSSFVSNLSFAQSFYFGADLSYVNEMQDCGANYNIAGTPADPYEIFKANGANLVRLRLWHTPSWYDALNQGKRYSDFQDVRHSIMRAKSNGMQVLLDFHLSDTWADPAHQVIPGAWAPVVNNLETLKDSLYNYIYSTLTDLGNEGLLPDLVQIGNETNRGILLSQAVNDAGWTLDWTRNAALFNKAILAVRNSANAFDTSIQIVLHVANPAESGWLMEGFWSHGVRDFDVIGLSYYYQFHDIEFNEVGSRITTLRSTYPTKKVMLLETGYQWTSANADAANNILSKVYPGYAPNTPAHQKQWMTDLTQTVINHGGSGVIYWEPAWVGNSCFTRYGKGSNWDNATFFDSNETLLPDGGIGWMTYPYQFTTALDQVRPDLASIEISISDDQVFIHSQRPLSIRGPIRFSIFGIDGKIVSGFQMSADELENGTALSISELGAGMYFVSGTNSGSLLFTGKFVCF